MKKMYTIACLSIGMFTAHAQTFSPAFKSSGSNTFSYDFSQVKGNSSKQIDFTISGVANGTIFNASIEQELDFVDNGYCDVTYGDSNFVISSGKSGVITQNKGIITVLFDPKDFEYNKIVYFRDWDGKETTSFDHCEMDYFANYGTKTAKMTVTLYTPNATNYTLNLSGNSVSVITALEGDTKAKTQNVSLFYPNPVKDVLVLNQEATVYDAFGILILSGKGKIDVSGLHSGIYFVQSVGQTQKFVKE